MLRENQYIFEQSNQMHRNVGQMYAYVNQRFGSISIAASLDSRTLHECIRYTESILNDSQCVNDSPIKIKSEQLFHDWDYAYVYQHLMDDQMMMVMMILVLKSRACD